MALNKKKLSSIGFFVLLFMLFIGTPSSYCSQNFNFTPDNLKGIYYTFYNNQKAYAVSGDQYYQTKLNVWDSGEEIIYQISDNQWEEMAQNLNIMMTQAWITSGDFYGYNTNMMNDSNLWVTVIPSTSQTNTTPQIGFIFLPQITVTTALLENKGNYNTSSFYSVQPSFYLNSGEPGNMFVDTSTINATKSPAIELRILSNGNYSVQIHNSQTMSKLNSLAQYFRQWDPITYDTSSHYVSYYGIMTTYRDDYNLTLKGQSTFKRNYANTPWMQSYNGYRYNLGTNTIYSGDYIAPTSTPTPSPTSSPGGGSVDLTETNNLISDINDTLTTVPDISSYTITSGEITSSLGFNISGDPYDNFWTFLTNGLSSALTNTNRTITLSLFGLNYTINLDDTIPHYPEGIQVLLNIICIYGITLFIVKQIREMSITIQSGNMDAILEMNEESGIVDIF